MLREFSKLFFNVLIEILQRGKNYRERWIWTTKIDINITLGIVKPRFRNNFRDWIISWNQFSKKWVSSTNLTQNFNFLELIHPFLFFFFFCLTIMSLYEKRKEKISHLLQFATRIPRIPFYQTSSNHSWKPLTTVLYLHLNRGRVLIILGLRRVKNADCIVDLIAAGHLHMPNCITRASSSLALPRQNKPKAAKILQRTSQFSITGQSPASRP